MKTITDIISEAQATFAEIDGNIAELKTRACDLQRQIAASGGISLEAIQTTSTLRTELAQVKEAIERAQGVRKAMTVSYAEKALKEVPAARQSRYNELSEEYAPKRDQFLALVEQLRDAVEDLEDLQERENRWFREQVEELKPYFPTDHESRRRFGYLRDTYMDSFKTRPDEHNDSKVYAEIWEQVKRRREHNAAIEERCEA